MRKDFSRTAAVLLAAAPLLASSALAWDSFTAPDARERAGAIALVVFLDLPGSADIIRGNYESGLDKATAALDRPGRHEMELTTNICAAQVKLGSPEAANRSCEAALAGRLPARSAMTPREFRAVAHVNHGVVHLVQGDTEFAILEFRRAKTMDPTLRVAASNAALAREMERQPRIQVGETL